MSMFYIVFSIAFILSLGLNLYFWLSRQDLSIESGLNRLKTSLIRMIVFYQDKYSGSDQLVFMAKWIQQVKDKIKSAPAHEKDLFKEIVNSL